MNNYNYIPICNVRFDGYLKRYPDIQIAAFNIADLIRGIACNYPDFERDIWLHNANDKRFVVIVNDQFKVTSIADTQVLIPFVENTVEIICVDAMEGKNLLPVLLGVALIGAAFAGVGILGISSTTIGLLGASLVASSIFKTPKIDTKERTDKRSINFTGTINTTGGGQPLALVFGEAWVGSAVASAFISPEERSVN